MKPLLRGGLCLVLFLLAGCSTDRTALREFSRAYARFYDTVVGIEVPARIALYLRNVYGLALHDALDADATNHSRAQAAALTISMYNTQVEPALAEAALNLSHMNGALDTLVVTAHAIRDAEARQLAVEVTQHARDMELAYAALLDRSRQKLRLQVGAAQKMVVMSGSMQAFSYMVHDADEIPRLAEECDRQWRAAMTSGNRASDAFAALRGRFRVPEYPSAWDTTETSRRSR